MQNTDPHVPNPGADSQAPGAGDEQLAEIEALNAKLGEAEATIGQLRETMLRERAEIENQRRRLQRDLDQARRYANEKLLGELLPLYDGLDRGLTVEGDVAAIREGISLSLKALNKLAENNGLAVVDPLHQPFDPDRHQAMSLVDSREHAPNTVVAVLQKGFVLNDRLLRPALVAVAKDPD
jgi:molecular chaperone GrpE